MPSHGLLPTLIVEFCYSISKECAFNCRVKFGAFYDFLDQHHPGQFDRIASGHYAKIERALDLERPVALQMTSDAIKDQTYFLANLTQQQLSKAMFPLGTLTKVVRATAFRMGHWT